MPPKRKGNIGANEAKNDEILHNRSLRDSKRYACLSDEQRASKIQASSQNRKLRKECASAKDFEPCIRLSKPHILPKTTSCSFCFAKRIKHEPPSFCCGGGKILLRSPQPPDELYNLFVSNEKEAIDFRRKTRVYNSMFAFTSFGVNLDTDLASSKNGVFTFLAQGQVYHYLPQLLPNPSGPRFFQLYFYDTANESQNRMKAMSYTTPNLTTINTLSSIMLRNPYATFFRNLQNEDLDACVIRIRTDAVLDQRVYNAPTVDQVAAIWVEGNDPTAPQVRDIVVRSKSGEPHQVKYYFGCYDPLQYPLLFPHGELGWHPNILKLHKADKSLAGPSSVEEFSIPNLTSAADVFVNEVSDDGSPNKVSAREYYCYKLQIRPREHSILLRSQRLLHQFVVDMYIKIETTRLDFLRNKQSHLRAELYQGIVDSFMGGEHEGKKIGRLVVLPASFVGGPRDMRRRYLDSITLVSKFGRPHLFITMTCNPEWKEIKDLLDEGQTPQDRPDVCVRIFRAKLMDLKDQLFSKEIFGKVAAYVFVVEFQKRGLPHVHLLLIFNDKNRFNTPEQFDSYVSCEMPDQNLHPDLYNKVVKHMMHGPCGDANRSNACMINNKCRSHYPRPFCAETRLGKDSYPIYRRRDDGRCVLVRRCYLDNRWVVPYNPYLLSRYDCHINVEICAGVRAVKYLYKYIYKGHDKIAVQIHENNGEPIIDEIHHYQDARWVAAPEAVWRIYGFTLNEMYPAVINLQLHLPNKQSVSFYENHNLRSILHSEFASKSMLTEFFRYCLNDTKRELHLYRDFPENFTWNRQARLWTPRRHKKRVVGRINMASPREGERYYLRLLLNHVRRPTSFEDLMYNNGIQHKTFKEAAQHSGLLQSDNWIEETLLEGASFQMARAFRRLFATILVFCEPLNVRGLWDTFYNDLSADYQMDPNAKENVVLAKCIADLEYFLDGMGRDIKEFDIPEPNFEDFEKNEAYNNLNIHEPREILDEIAIVTPESDKDVHAKLNMEQMEAYNLVMEYVNAEQPGTFFIDGPGGTGKTYLYRALLSTIRQQGKIAIATATSGVAASIMPGGRTAHSRFKISIDGDEAGVCNIARQSGTAKLLKRSSIIIWDEAPMAKRWDIEALDRTLQDLLMNKIMFGGKIIVFGGDFRQVLPVIPRATRAEMVNASLVKSFLWPHMIKFNLTTNMRASADPLFCSFLLRVGNGEEPTNKDDEIQIPEAMTIDYAESDLSDNAIINAVFPRIHEEGLHQNYITSRAILATRNETIDKLNSILINIFPGEPMAYTSYDKASDDTRNCYPEEFLNTLTPNGLPPHELILKINCPIMLLRNLSPSEGLCNGTRMVCQGFSKNIINAEITIGQYAGKRVLLHRIPLFPPKNDTFPFQFQRMQFPIRLCFAMTINKSQGQTIPNVGIYLPQSVFSHGQLYVALSRSTSMSTTKVLIQKKRGEKKG